jgi:hypothetical protein
MYGFPVFKVHDTICMQLERSSQRHRCRELIGASRWSGDFQRPGHCHGRLHSDNSEVCSWVHLVCAIGKFPTVWCCARFASIHLLCGTGVLRMSLVPISLRLYSPYVRTPVAIASKASDVLREKLYWSAAPRR